MNNDLERIPPIIHYIWFGGGKHSRLQKKCIKSWSNYCPDYEIRCWNEKNYDISSAPLFVRQAYNEKKWAFVSDYVRLKVLYDYGGLYFDTDAEVLKDISHLRNNHAFLAFEYNEMLNNAVMGACKGDPLLKELLGVYEKLSFYDKEGKLNTVVIGKYTTEIFLKHGLVLDGKEQLVENWRVYPFQFFYPVKLINDNTYYTKDTCIVHWFEATWHPEDYKRARRHDKNPLIRLFRKLPISSLYYKIRNKKQ